ncbi:MAG: hypothetical protein RL189_359 [Pseudomonadota bacterium]|jgi:hypothetical protein
MQTQEVSRDKTNRGGSSTLVFLLNEQAWLALAQMTDANVQALVQKCDGLEVLGQRDGTWVFLLR